jgi:hypothetical protein
MERPRAQDAARRSAEPAEHLLELVARQQSHAVAFEVSWQVQEATQ